MVLLGERALMASQTTDSSGPYVWAIFSCAYTALGVLPHGAARFQNHSHIKIVKRLIC